MWLSFPSASATRTEWLHIRGSDRPETLREGHGEMVLLHSSTSWPWENNITLYQQCGEPELNRILLTKLTALLSFTQPCVISNQYDFPSSVQHKRRFVFCWMSDDLFEGLSFFLYNEIEWVHTSNSKITDTIKSRIKVIFSKSIKVHYKLHFLKSYNSFATEGNFTVIYWQIKCGTFDNKNICSWDTLWLKYSCMNLTTFMIH